MTLRSLADNAASRLRSRGAPAMPPASPGPAPPASPGPAPPASPGPAPPDAVQPRAPAPRRSRLTRRAVSLAPALTGLALGLLALGPGLDRGFLLSYDMVFVPRMPFSGALLGITGGPPRAVPSDAVVAVASRALPAEIAQKIILLLIFVLACAGAAALLDSAWTGRGAPLLARLAAGACYAWNPYLAERLLIGQWALLLGYAAMPWLVRVLCTGPERVRPGRLAGVMVPAAIGGFRAMSVIALAAVSAALTGGKGRERARRLVTVLAALALLSLPWLIPALAVPVHTDPRGVYAFAARADTPFGRVGSLLMLSGIWNGQTVPRGYGGGASVFWLLVVAASVAGYVWLVRPRRLRVGLGVAALAGLAIALTGVTSPGRAALRDLIAAWPGAAVLRDGQEYLAPLALAEAIGVGALVAWVIAVAARAAREPSGWTPRAARPAAAAPGPGGPAPGAARGAAAALGVMAVLAPVLLLPGMAWGMAGRLRPVEYPADWLAVRRVIDGDPGPGSVLLLPWAAYRRYPWNGGEAVFDPWARFTGREVIANDALSVGSMTVAPESPDSVKLNRIVDTPGPLTGPLRAAGVRYVIIDAGPLLRRAASARRAGPPAAGGPAAGTPAAGGPSTGGTAAALAAAARLPGAQVVIASGDVILFRLPG